MDFRSQIVHIVRARTMSACILAALLSIGSATAPRLDAQMRKSSRGGDPLDRAVAVWAKVKTVRATFEQTIVNPLTGSTVKASGEYQQQRPSKISVRFDDPAEDRIVADGKYVWVYLPSTSPGQVIRSGQQAGGTGTVDLTAQFLNDPRSRFIVSNAVGLTGSATHEYSLVPKNQSGAPFVKAIVQIDDARAMIRQFTITEHSGIERTVRLTSLKVNVPVQASAFVFIPPAGTHIVAR